ncbi:MAG: iron complex transport system ATP-binding protein [Candidatus Azotimanducaceae bacterium]|jgi:iron complex transport system ATP-binding protein
MVIRVTDLSYSASDVDLVCDLNIEFQSGALHVLLGANGAGKTTLLRCLSGELSPTTGQVLLDGRSLADYSLLEKAHRIAVLPQKSVLDFPFLAREVVAMGRYAFLENAASVKSLLKEVAEATQAVDLLDQYYTTLSGGEQQRVQLGRVLVQLWDHLPEAVYLLDEPSAPLDLAHQIGLFVLLRKLASTGATVIVSTHDLNVAANFADNLLLLRDGQLLASGEPRSVLSAANIEKAYGVKVTANYNDRGRLQIDYEIE